MARVAAGVAFLDPRLVPARLLGLGDAAEIDVAPMDREGRAAVHVRVAASAELVAGTGPDIAVRLVDRRTGAILCFGLLSGLVTIRARSLNEVDDLYYEGIVELPDAIDPGYLRVDLVDAGIERPHPPATDEELLRIRRAVRFLSEWRALVADARLFGEAASPAARMGDIIRRLDAGPTDRPMRAVWPSVDALHQLTGPGDRRLLALLAAGADAPEDAGAAAVLATVRGAGDLLVAEVAAAFERTVA